MSPKVCVIGAGCSGLAAIKNLVQAGVEDLVCYEQNDQLGGNWVYTAQTSHSSVCETTHIISSKTLSEYLDFPMPTHYPDYPSHRQVLAYFQSYATTYELEQYIQFNTKVKKVEQTSDQRWKVSLESGEVNAFDYVLIANGHHAVPRHPELKEQFEGEYLHSHAFKNNQGYAGKRVLVIGAGNSGCDCAVEISRVADFVGISIRTPQYIVPKFLLGKPTDTFNEGMLWVPNAIKRVLHKISLKIQVGNYEDYGLEQPKHDVIKAHPTLNSELLYKIRHGKVHPRRGIDKVIGKTVFFADGKSEDFDVIVAATGYKISTPFFDSAFLDYEESYRVPLYLRMFHPTYKGLIFIGLVQPQGAVWPLSDRQAKLAANQIMGRWSLPENLAKLAEQDADEIEREFLKRKRHSVEVHYHQFARRLESEIPKNAPKWTKKREQAAV